MKKIRVTVLFLFFTIISYTQMPWTYTNTGSNHTVLIQAGTITIGGNPIVTGDYIGVFYNDAGILVCGGYTQLISGATNAVTAWGDDAATTIKDGFSPEELFIWKVWRASDESIIDMTATYDNSFPNSGNYLTNGMSGIFTLTGIEPLTVDTQILTLPYYWSIFSLYLQPVQPDIAYVFNPVYSNLIIIKDWNGQSYWPQFGVNLIGDLIPGHGYQIKMSAADTLEVEGNILNPDTTAIILPYYWSILGYIRTTSASIVDMLDPIYNHINIVKDWDGQAYWPIYGINLIGDMQPGQGYQIKMTAQDTLYYPSQAVLPIITTTNITAITDTSAITGGEVIADGGSYVTVYGVCYNTTGTPTTADSFTSDGTGTGIFTSNLSGLVTNSIYYVRAYATNEIGTVYGIEESFTTTGGTCPSIITDFDGNNYSTVLIGTQCWMQENLKVIHYPNGTAIPNVTGNFAWGALGDNGTDDAYCWFNNDINNKDIYGALYTWAAAMGDNATGIINPNGEQGICPSGWHLPSDNEWKQLEMQLGMSQSEADATVWRGTDEGSQLASDLLLWNSGNLENNSQFGTSGFMALPAGFRYYDYGSFENLGLGAYWWSSTQSNSSYAWYRMLHYTFSGVGRNNYSKSFGLSVRCLRD